MHCISSVSSQLCSLYAFVTSKKDYFLAYLITYFWYGTLLKFLLPKTSILLICTAKIDTTNIISIAIVNDAIW